MPPSFMVSRWVPMIFTGYEDVITSVFSEHVKTRRRNFPSCAMRELVCNGQLWARAAVRQLCQTARVFCSNSLAKTQEMTVVIQCILTSAQSFGSQRYCNKSLITILGLAGVLFCKMSRHGQNELSFVPKKVLTWVPIGR